MSSNQNLQTSQSRRLKGRALTRIDREQTMLNSGPLGGQRLLLNVALDLMEQYPGMTSEQAYLAAFGYCARTHNNI